MYLASVSSRLLLHDVNSWDLKKFYGCYEGILRDIAWSDDGKYLLQVNPKGLVEILSSAEHDVRSLQHVPFKETWSACFHREGHRNVAIGTKSGNILIWDTKNKIITKAFPTPSQQSPVNFISFNSKNTSLAASMQNGDTVIYGLASNIPVLTVKLSCSKNITAMKFHHESRALLGLATDEGHVVLKDIATNKDKVFFENVHASPVSDFTYSLVNRDVMLSCGYDKIMHVYDIRFQNVVSSTRTTSTLTSLAINLDNQVALGTKTGVMLIYDLRDLTSPLKTLKGHVEEVQKVSFQPLNKKAISTEVSLREDVEIKTPQKSESAITNRSTDIFHVNDISIRNNLDMTGPTGDKADSFLVMMGMDKSHSEFISDATKTELETCIENNELRYRQAEVDKNITKASTPIINKTAEIIDLPSPICILKAAADDLNDNHATPSSNTDSNPNINKISSNVDAKLADELRDSVKLTMADIADDNRNYFLHIMMALTKQKLYLEKQMARMNEQIETLIKNQDALVEINRILVAEVDNLKSQRL